MLIGVKSLIKESWSLYIKNFGLLTKIVVWLIIPVILFSILSALDLNPAVLIPINFFLSVISFLLGLWISIVLIIIINNLWNKTKIDLKQTYETSYSKILSYLWVSILANLAIFGGILLLIIPGIIFAVWFAFCAYILIIENIKGVQALQASKNLVQGYFWPIFWRWFATYFVYGLLIAVIILIPIYLIGFSLGNPSLGFTPQAPWWSSLIANVISVFTIPLLTSIGVILYNSLKKEKETIEK